MVVHYGNPPRRRLGRALAARLAASLLTVPAARRTQVETGVAKLPPGPLKQSLTALLAESGGDLDAFKRGVETWFDDAIDRVSGTDKRFVHFATLVIGLVPAVLLNVDTLRITTTLWVEPRTRAALAEAATRYLDAPRELAADKVQALSDEARAQLAGLPVPMGWSADAQGRRPLGWSSPIGWLLTGLAISLCAPFWFDLLQRLVNLRAAGPKPARADAPKPDGAKDEGTSQTL